MAFSFSYGCNNVQCPRGYTWVEGEGCTEKTSDGPYCPGDPFAAICGGSAFQAGDPDCMCEDMTYGCVNAFEDDIDFTEKKKKTLCHSELSSSDPAKEKCCRTYMGSPSGVIKEVYHDCVMGTNPAPGQGVEPPECYIPLVHGSRCHPFNADLKPDADTINRRDCNKIHYYGVCFEKCKNIGEICNSNSDCCSRQCQRDLLREIITIPFYCQIEDNSAFPSKRCGVLCDNYCGNLFDPDSSLICYDPSRKCCRVDDEGTYFLVDKDSEGNCPGECYAGGADLPSFIPDPCSGKSEDTCHGQVCIPNTYLIDPENPTASTQVIQTCAAYTQGGAYDQCDGTICDLIECRWRD